MAKKHLAIMNKSVAEAILSGKKTIETRFSKHRIAPFGCVSVGDIVYMKLPGGEIVGQYTIRKVFYFEGLNAEDINKIFSDYGADIYTGDRVEDELYLKSKKGSSYGTLLFIDQSERLITSPLNFQKSDSRGWVVLN